MALVIENLGKTFPGGVEALRDFSLTVDEGELVAIVGPSGCGKSTLMRLIAGLEDATSGSMRLGDRALNGPPRARDVAIVFQSYTLLPHLTVGENLAFGLKLRGASKAEREAKARETAALLGIENLLARFPSEISGGERQRTALGRAVLREPRVFLFDEPLSSLDAQMRFQLRVEIQRLRQRISAPMLFVTHDQSEALTLGDRVLVLNQGRIQQTATPDALCRKPANTFVASFIGSPGMNLFSGTVENGASPRFTSPSLTFPLTPEQAMGLQNRSEIQVGIRPEHFRPVPVEAAWLRGNVTIQEKQAGSACLYFQNGNASFAVKVSGDDFTAGPGDVLGFAFSPDQAVFFDPQSGNLAFAGKGA